MSHRAVKRFTAAAASCGYLCALDTTGISRYYAEVRDKGLLYRFALDYSDANRATLSRLRLPRNLSKT